MKQYIENIAGEYNCEGTTYPVRFKLQIEAEVEAGEAQIVPYTEPEPTVQDQIAALEATVTQRRIREAALTTAGKSWLKAVDDQIAALR